MAFTVSKQTATWLLILTVVAIILAAIQIIRVNRPKEIGSQVQRRTYTSPGTVLPSRVEIGPNSFYSHRLDLNRRMKLRGSFRTADLKSTVLVLIVRESEFENWKRGSDVPTIVRTGLVPGGNLSPVLEPDVYQLIIDNRNGEQTKTVATDFRLE